MSNESFDIVDRPGPASPAPRAPPGTNTRGTGAPTASIAGPSGRSVNRGTVGHQPAEAGTALVGTSTPTEPTSAGQVEQQRRVEELDGVVDRFRSGEYSKAKAIALVFRILEFDPDSGDRAQEQTLELYLSAINSHETVTRESLKRGAPYGGNLVEEQQIAGDLLQPRPDPEVDRRINDLISELSAKSVAADQGDDDDADRPSKRARLSLSDMPWYRAELERRDTENPICRQTRETLATFARDITQVKIWIHDSRFAPSGFPSSQWDRLVRGEAVDLNAVFSNLHRTQPATENVGRLGDTQITFGFSQPKKRVQSAGDWISAWNRVIRATTFLFPHREEELREYGEYIESLFAAKISTTHPRIIMYDVAVRNEVAGGQRCVLSDTSKFNHLYSAIVAADGVEASRSSGSRGQPGASPKNSKATNPICHRFNSTAGCNSSDCKFPHVCRICREPGHTGEQCDKRGKQ